MSAAANNQTFERLLRPHLDRLYRFAWRLTGRKVEAEDLFQELLIKAFGKLDDLVQIEEPGSWLCRVMYNLFIDEQRRFKRQRMMTVQEGQLSDEGRDCQGPAIQIMTTSVSRRSGASIPPFGSSATSTASWSSCTTQRATK